MKKRLCTLTLLLLALLLLPFATVAGSSVGDGRAEGAARGYGGELVIELEMEAEEIVAVRVKEHQETDGVSDLALSTLVEEIVAQQSLALDYVAGATLTSQAVLQAARAALEELGVDSAPYLQAEEQAEKETEANQNVDVIIVGGGLAGCLAGLEMERIGYGLTYVVLEQLPVVGGSLPITGGAFMATDSKLHAAAGRTSTLDDVLAAFHDSSGERPINEALIQTVMRIAGDTLDLLNEEVGVEFQAELLPSTPYSDALYAAWAEGGGAGFYKAFSRYMLEHINLRLNARVTDLLVEDGRVIGVAVEEADRRYNLYADAVLLTTGGFAANPERMQELLPKLADGVITALAGSTGDGLRFVEAFDTPLVGEGSMGTVMTPAGERPLVTPFLVNLEGLRFANELDLSYRLQRQLAEQTDQTAFFLADGDHPNREQLEAEVAAGIYTEYESLTDLASDLGLDAVALQDTIEAYNAALESGQSPGFELPTEEALPFGQAPFFASRVVPRTFATIPGVEVDPWTHVLDGDGVIVPGLYAAGELIAGNAFSGQYPGAGIGISWAASSGRYSAAMIALALVDP